MGANGLLRTTQMGVVRLLFLGLLTASAAWPSARAADTPETQGERYALLIGVNAYEHQKDILRNADLNSPEADAAALGECLRDHGYARDNVVIMTSAKQPAANRATAEGIRKQLKDLAGRAKAEDVIVVAFSGYEMQFAGSDDYFLCPTDARAQDKATMIALTEVYDELARCKATCKLVVVDSCRSSEKGNKAAKRPKGPPEDCAVLFGCSAGEFAYETGALGGLLSSSIVKGLKGGAGKAGEVTVTDLAAYTRYEVAKLAAKEVGEQQTPELFGRTGSQSLVAKPR